MQALQLVTSSPQSLVLRTLGGFGLYRQGEATPLFPAGKPVALLVYLSALPGRTANREQLLNLLWADLEPHAARHALRQTTWYLRQRLGGDPLDAGNDHIALTASLECDRDRFLDAVQAGRLAEAVELYRGEFLGGFAVPGGLAFEHWAEAERQRLQMLFRHAAERVAREEMERGQFRAARELGVRARDADPFDESGWRLLMEACLAHDDRVSALAEGERLQRLLSELGREPEPATRSLLRRANAQPEEREAPEDDAPVAELVGREGEFSALLRASQAARKGGARVMSLTGPPGLGKTRLLLDLARRLAAGGTPAVYVRAQPGDRDIPGSYLAGVARQLAERPGARGVSPASASSLVALDPSVSGHLPARPDPATGSEARRRRVAAVAELIEAVAHEQPFALLLDDLHWADPESRDCLQHAIPRARGAAVLVVMAARPGAALGGVEPDHQIPLAPLTPDQTEALVSSLGELPRADWAAEFAQRLHSAGEGSPLLVLETLQLALETGVLRRLNGTWECPNQKALFALLETGSALGRRIGELDREQHWLLLLLAVAGTPLPGETLLRATGQVPDGAQVNLDALERRGLVAREGTGWTVAHDEIAQRVDDAADPRQRAAAHGALGRALLPRGPAPDGAGLRAAARHFAAASLGRDLEDVATAWVRRARASGDGRSPRAVLADLLGVEPGDEAVRRVLGALPWSLRLRHARPLAAAAAGVLLLLAGVVAAALRTGSSGPGVLVATWAEQPGGQYRLKAHELSQRDIARGHVSLASFQGTEVVSPSRPEGILRPGAAGTLATTSAYPDSGGLEVVLTSTHGPPVTRLTRQPGDDYARAWSPDGRYLAIVTDRWSQRSRSDLALVDPDRPDLPPVRLTRNPDARDDLPEWSPDGTRIAFQRQAPGDPPVSLCMVSVDGTGERCLRIPGFQSRGPGGWVSPVEIASQFLDRRGVVRILAVNLVTGDHREIAEGQIAGPSHAPGWITCFCRRSTAEPFQLLVIPAAHPEQAIRVEPGDPPPLLPLFPTGTPTSYLARVEIEAPEHAVPVDAAYGLVLEGWDAAGDPMRPLAVTWSISDTTVATVDSLGVLHGRREGTATVRASAGGWRADSVRVRVRPAEAVTVMVEDWSDKKLAAWVPFGTPRPVVVRTGRGNALAPNGDSTFNSGVFLRRRLPADRGIGLEAEVSTPLTRLVWQNLNLQLMAAKVVDTTRGDLDAGNMSWLEQVWRECGLHYPSTESRPGQRALIFEAGLSRLIPVPGMASGRWTRVRLQVFPDGRCGIAIDGEPRAILDRRVPLGDSVTVVALSYSFHTRILVGHLEAWTGVRRDVNWDALGRE